MLKNHWFYNVFWQPSHTKDVCEVVDAARMRLGSTFQHQRCPKRRTRRARADGEAQRAAIGNQGAGRVWLFLKVEDFAAEFDRLTAAGVTFEEEPRHEPYGKVAVFRDPFGNRWDLLGD